MYYVPKGTQICGFYECEKCGDRFLDLKVAPVINCPNCDREVDMEIGPDEEMPDLTPSAKLIQVCEGEEVEKMDQLLSLAITGGDWDWI
ncbi:MAG: FYDLN acid domain-containing protein [Lachnospiraceae bacterium]|nr:FYDLN acid domain-containing protein [Lachnospiraceae bacterium]